MELTAILRDTQCGPVSLTFAEKSQKLNKNRYNNYPVLSGVRCYVQLPLELSPSSNHPVTVSRDSQSPQTGVQS